MIQTKAIVLSAIKFQETSLIVRCYTQEGVRSYLLKGVLKHKKKAITPAYFQPLSQLEVITTDRNDGTLEYIKEVKVSYPYKNLHQSVIRSSVLFFLAEIGGSVLQEEVQQGILDIRESFASVIRYINFLNKEKLDDKLGTLLNSPDTLTLSPNHLLPSQ